ncbi:esterase-like activity of phytase family protein [Nocardioides sp.]|uniref:esterase-like activity of phytase family protein n=1 Tax=Nocardioides sp. TaxID=35761 RepID=UPI00356904D1
MLSSRRPIRGIALSTTGALVAAALTQVSVNPSAQAAPPSASTGAHYFQRLATYPVYLNVPAGVDPADETVAEISTVTADGMTMIYTDAAGQRIGFLDITDPANPVGDGSIDLTVLGDADDQPTSVATVGDYVLVVIDTSGGDFTNPSGRVDVVKVSDRTVVRSIDLGGQPDSIAVSPDLSHVAIAMENQRDEEAPADGGGGEGDLPQAPAGFVQILDIPDPAAPAGWTSTALPLTAGDLAGLDTPEDAEPEYVDINADNKLALSLQENNGVVIIDLDTKTIDTAFSAGTVTLSGIDTTKNSLFDPTGGFTDNPREPDSLHWVGQGLVATANEGDWKGGTRGWTVFDSATGDVVWDAGTSFEYIATSHGLFNNDRAAKKGSEPEGLAYAEFAGTPYVFVGSERSNFVAVYDMTDPANPVFVQVLPTTNGPEGLLPVPGRNLLLTSSEVDDSEVGVRASIGVFEFGTTAPAFPSIASTPTNGTAKPIGWTALSALSPAPGDSTHLWTASDSAVAQGRIYSVDVSSTPAVIENSIDITDSSGNPLGLDIEGIAARAGGGFWVGVEGATGPTNELVRLSSSGVAKQRVQLPAAVANHIKKWGIEGAAVSGTGASEQVFVALQRPLWVDPSAGSLVELEGNNARIGKYDVFTGEWTWYLYPLETTSVAGDWIGLSEIAVVDDDTVAVIERDKLNGPNAAVKRIYTVDLPDAAPGTVTAVTKSLAFDALPEMTALNGWTQEKLEGFTIGADQQVYAVTDNDGVDDATGETLFLRLGAATGIFDDSLLASSTRLTAPKKVQAKKRFKLKAFVPGVSEGTVVFTSGTKTLGRAAVVGGKAVVKVRLTKKGRYRVVAHFSGTDEFETSDSNRVTIKVIKKKNKKNKKS